MRRKGEQAAYNFARENFISHKTCEQGPIVSNGSSRKINSRRLFSRECDFPKTFSLTEIQFSGKTYLYTIRPRASSCSRSCRETATGSRRRSSTSASSAEIEARGSYYISSWNREEFAGHRQIMHSGTINVYLGEKSTAKTEDTVKLCVREQLSINVYLGENSVAKTRGPTGLPITATNSASKVNLKH